MGDVPQGFFYTKTHEWARREGTEAVVGITSHAQEELRDVVFVELPKPGRVVRQGEAVAVIESVKAAFDIYAPVSGTVTRVNGALVTTPQLVNQECYGAGWLFAVSPSSAEEYAKLMSAEEYAAQLRAVGSQP
jgi:glycine cleavage system H protein